MHTRHHLYGMGNEQRDGRVAMPAAMQLVDRVRALDVLCAAERLSKNGDVRVK